MISLYKFFFSFELIIFTEIIVKSNYGLNIGIFVFVENITGYIMAIIVMVFCRVNEFQAGVFHS